MGKITKDTRQKIIDRAIIFSKQLDERMKDMKLLKEAKEFSKKVSKATLDDLIDIYGE